MPLNGPQVRDYILKQGYTFLEATAYSLGNFTEAIANTGKGILRAQSGSRIGSGAFKATTDFSRKDIICGTLCSVYIECETACAVIIWLPIPCKFTIIGILKGVSYGSTKFRDMCAADPL